MTRCTTSTRTEGQSPWLDNLRRDWLEDGRLAGWSTRASGG